MVNNNSCCIAKILKVIEILQKNASCDSCEDGCDKPFLGPTLNCICYNTRPITLYTRSGELFTANYTSNGVMNTSNVFRVEKVHDCCAKLRILAFDNTTQSYIATNNFITVNLKCMCVVACLNDLALDNIC